MVGINNLPDTHQTWEVGAADGRAYYGLDKLNSVPFGTCSKKEMFFDNYN